MRLSGVLKCFAFNTQGAQQPVLIDLLDASDDEIGNVYSHVTREGDSVTAEGFIPSLYSGRRCIRMDQGITAV